MECEGACKAFNKCKGDTKIVHIIDPKDNYDWGYFYYCDTAIETDRKNGFLVVVET